MWNRSCPPIRWMWCSATPAPLRYIPTEAFLPGVKQSQVDRHTEEWLGEIERKYDYQAWFCGHWHIDKRIDKLHFLFHGWETL